MNKFIFILVGLFAWSAFAQDLLSEPEPEREPAAIAPMATKRTYPGGADEEDLRVQSALPEARIATDARTIQREVYKSLYNQDLKDERPENEEE
jgi:hypothetical protein